MLTYTEVNNWFKQYLESGVAITELPESAISDALALYDKQDKVFNENVKAKMSDFHGQYLIDALGAMTPAKYNPTATDRTANGVGCVLLSSYPQDNIFKVFVSLTVPKFYHLLVNINLDKDKKITGGNLTMTTFYDSATKKPQRYVVTGPGELFDALKDYKTRVDTNKTIEDPMDNKVKGKITFVPGKGIQPAEVP